MCAKTRQVELSEHAWEQSHRYTRYWNLIDQYDTPVSWPTNMIYLGSHLCIASIVLVYVVKD